MNKEIEKIKNHSLYIPVVLYNTAVRVWICSEEEAHRRYKKTIFFDEGHKLSLEGCNGHLLATDGYMPILWIRKEILQPKQEKFFIPYLVHEITHVTNWILNNRGLTLSESSDEAYAYMNQYFIYEILKKIKYKGVKYE